MQTRLAVLLLLVAGYCHGQAETAVATRLMTEFKETYRYAPVDHGQEMPALDGEPVLELEPMIITRSMETDLFAEARRQTEIRKAREFSPLKGGTIHSFHRGEVGFWPKIVPMNDTPVKKGDVLLVVDILRLKW